ncbi:hypothetical protein IFM89_019810 [Coptis chinensis]|uniref:Cytochrome P450 n=1 Tax=Coptis chinensis TaxID=261450 RepID=A0A835IE02_9MAGN|nr:hypothetical protein IFM89_019810 [Coptis chinensis]
MSFNVTSNVMLSKDIVDLESKKDVEFVTSIANAIELGGQPNIADFFPFLWCLDPQGIKRKMKGDRVYTHKFAYGFVEKRILKRKNRKKNTKNDFLDVLLDFQGNQRDGELENILEKNIGIMILAVVKETLRLHPPVPQRVMENTKFMGYSVPKDTQILVNIWGSGCVGMSLAHRTLHLALGSLIQSFEWALEDGVINARKYGHDRKVGCSTEKG